MKRISLFVCILLLLPLVPVSGTEVDREELEIVEPGAVEFLNYEGPHTVINTRNEIISIGRTMGSQFTGGSGVFTYHDKYSVIHAAGPEDEIGMPADIFIIGSGAGVDHIRNLRRIVAGYLSSAYDYEFDTAYLIAEFATVYNAVFRRDMDTISSKYSATVLGYLEPEKVGISTRYNEWAGNTMMLIPLTGGAGRGAPGTVSSEEISSNEVIEKMREDEDRGIEQRKGMVELREDEAEAEQERITREQEDLEQEQARLREKSKDLEEQIARAEEEGPGADEELERELEKTRDELAATEERRQELEEEAKEQEERVERIREERERIAEDEKALIEETTAPVERPEAGTMFTIYTERGGALEGTLVRVDPATGSIKGRAAALTVLGRSFVEYRGDILLIGRDAEDFVTILLVDGETLEVVDRGTERVHRDSNIAVTEDGFYAAVISSGNVYLGRFDEELVLADRSADPVAPYSYIKPVEDTILIQSEAGDVRVLKSETLEEKD